jgi:hypothetical protein
MTLQVLSRAWSANIPRELLQSLPAKEINRQEALNEFIYTEEDYVRDLNLLDEVISSSINYSYNINK